MKNKNTNPEDKHPAKREKVTKELSQAEGALSTPGILKRMLKAFDVTTGLQYSATTKYNYEEFYAARKTAFGSLYLKQVTHLTDVFPEKESHRGKFYSIKDKAFWDNIKKKHKLSPRIIAIQQIQVKLCDIYQNYFHEYCEQYNAFLNAGSMHWPARTADKVDQSTITDLKMALANNQTTRHVIFELLEKYFIYCEEIKSIMRMGGSGWADIPKISHEILSLQKQCIPVVIYFSGSDGAHRVGNRKQFIDLVNAENNTDFVVNVNGAPEKAVHRGMSNTRMSVGQNAYSLAVILKQALERALVSNGSGYVEQPPSITPTLTPLPPPQHHLVRHF